MINRRIISVREHEKTQAVKPIPGAYLHNIPFLYIRVPDGIKEILEYLYREIIRDQPQDICAHAAILLENKLRKKEGFKKSRKVVQYLEFATAEVDHAQSVGSLSSNDEKDPKSDPPESAPQRAPKLEEGGEEISIDLEDKDVQKTAVFMQGQFRKKQKRNSLSQDSKHAQEAAAKKPEDEPKPEAEAEPEAKPEEAPEAEPEAKRAPKLEEGGEEISIDLEDKDVQKTAVFMQGQFRKKQKRNSMSQSMSQDSKQSASNGAAPEAPAPEAEEAPKE